ncbi:MAG: hypothetical protein GQ574_23045 [Crocinitomix sp.]|nr:hypothetical protein [Crocinitomix sp.]
MSYINQGGVMSNDGFKHYAVEFLMLNSKYYNHEFPLSIESDALSFVKNTSDFRHKDVVSAGVLTNTLVQLGYIEYFKKENNVRLYILTEKGRDFVNKANELKQR